jgi:hypothetical protein
MTFLRFPRKLKKISKFEDMGIDEWNSYLELVAHEFSKQMGFPLCVFFYAAGTAHVYGSLSKRVKNSSEIIEVMIPLF